MAQENAGSFRSFPTTHWSTIFRATNYGGETGRVALGRLLRLYLPALRAHLVFEKKLNQQDADDILQGFVTDKILEKDLIARADREKGKFRTFLLRSLDNYLISSIRRDNAQKRAPERAESLDPAVHGDIIHSTKEPSHAFELAWARRVLTLALKRMRMHCEETERQDIWGVFVGRVLNPILYRQEGLSYAEIIEEFDFDSPRQASNALVTAKRMFRRFLREVIAEYTEKAWDIEAELGELREILRRSEAGWAGRLRR